MSFPNGLKFESLENSNLQTLKVSITQICKVWKHQKLNCVAAVATVCSGAIIVSIITIGFCRIAQSNALWPIFVGSTQNGDHDHFREISF